MRCLLFFFFNDEQIFPQYYYQLQIVQISLIHVICIYLFNVFFYVYEQFIIIVLFEERFFNICAKNF